MLSSHQSILGHIQLTAWWKDSTPLEFPWLCGIKQGRFWPWQALTARLRRPITHLCPGYSPACLQVICTKVRDGAKRLVTIKEGDPRGRHVVIVDDLVQSGGTLIECHSVLAQSGAKHGESAASCTGQQAVVAHVPGMVMPTCDCPHSVGYCSCVILLFAVSAYVTHGVFPNFSWMKFKADTGGGCAGFQAFGVCLCSCSCM